MKITVNVECTPEEARAFFGLPNVAPLQDALLEQMKERMAASLNAMEPETLMRSWLPMQVQNLGAMQDFFWSQMAKAATGGSGRGSGGSEG
ncbi:DUF6489 family protein [Pararhodospirillum oryzae]|uniref:Ribosomal protein S1 n=1 Tax=Pararhodospirillum oryzae TaxID=478448 RepID=A0A512H3P2_9PROT|nr:DUF6489 family protein [Pararhodospirillum oryzae]GEO80043.1 hypothetical protein ROR02_01740 [Pararhodospirillum oryzae]